MFCHRLNDPQLEGPEFPYPSTINASIQVWNLNWEIDEYDLKWTAWRGNGHVEEFGTVYDFAREDPDQTIERVTSIIEGVTTLADLT